MESGTGYAEALSTNVVWFHRAVKAEKKAASGEPTNADIARALQNLTKKVDDLQKMGPPGFEELVELASHQFSLAAFLDAFLARVMKATGAKIGSILLKDPLTGNFRIAASKSEGDGPRKDEIITIENSVMKLAVDGKTALLVEDIEKHPEIARPNKPRYGSPSFLSVPIVERDECRGVMNLAGKDEQLIFGENDKGIVIKMLPEIITTLSKRGGLPNGIFNR